MMHQNSIVLLLALTLIILASLALAIRIFSRRIVIAVISVVLFFWVIHPQLRNELLAAFSPLVSVITPLLLILLGLQIMRRTRR
jgi:hypothetical protein